MTNNPPYLVDPHVFDLADFWLAAEREDMAPGDSTESAFVRHKWELAKQLQDVVEGYSEHELGI